MCISQSLSLHLFVAIYSGAWSLSLEELRVDTVGWLVGLTLSKELHREGVEALHLTGSSLQLGILYRHPVFHASIRKWHREEVLSSVTTWQAQLLALSPTPVQSCFTSVNEDDTFFSPWEVASLSVDIISANYRRFHVRLMQGDGTSG